MKGRIESSPDHSMKEEFKSKDSIEVLNNADHGDRYADIQPEAIINERMLKTAYRLQTIKNKRGRLRSSSAPMLHEFFSTDGILSDKITTKCPRMVRFSTVEVREYAMILGDNPAVSRGPPLTLDWTPLSRAFFDVERHIVMNPEPRRKIGEMVMPSVLREMLLKKSGYSTSEMFASTKQTNIVRAQRLATVRKLQMPNML